MSDPSIPMPTPTNPTRPLKTYTHISFDVYGTLVRYKSHILHSFTPLLNRLPHSSPYLGPTPLSTTIPNSATTGAITFLKLFQRTEDTLKLELAQNPRRFDAVLREIWTRIAAELEVDSPPSEAEAFGSESNVRSWPLFDGTLDALQALAERGYKLVALSNVDRWATALSFEATGLGDVKWDKVFTAEDFGTSQADLEAADQRKFEALLGHIGEQRDGLVHVAQSLGHDHKPARDAGVSSVFLVGDGPQWGKEEESRMAVEKGLVGYGWRCRDLREFAGLVEAESGS